jgi:lipid-binding SYLF domain-containing protein
MKKFQEKATRMTRLCGVCMAVVMISSVASAADTKAKQKQEDRLQNAGTVMGEILNIPDNIPQELLDRSKCVLVLPSVVKAAFIFGGSWSNVGMV